MKKFLTIEDELYVNIELFKRRPNNCIIAKIDGLGEFVQLANLMVRTAFILADRITCFADGDCEEENYEVTIITKCTKVSFEQLSILRELFTDMPSITIGNYLEAAVVCLVFTSKKKTN